VRQDQGFVIEGIVDGRAVTARWRGGGLVADEELRRRVQVIVGMGEEFTLDDPSVGSVRASLDGDLTAALLTVLRAFSSVTTIEVDLRPASERDARSGA
jgi:hypothetical protein